MLRPGFARISLPYFMSDSEIAFVLEALKMVATEGWKLLPQYIINPETGEWRHNSNTVRVTYTLNDAFFIFLFFYNIFLIINRDFREDLGEIFYTTLLKVNVLFLISCVRPWRNTSWK